MLGHKKLITVQEYPQTTQIEPTDRMWPAGRSLPTPDLQMSLHSDSQLCWFRIKRNVCRADVHRTFVYKLLFLLKLKRPLLFVWCAVSIITI